jgi:serine/threonine protein phosphatase PrpC
MVDDEEISQILAQDQLVDEKAKCLLNKALEHGGKDNITILVVEAD